MSESDLMSPKAEIFVQALEQLCRQHHVQLSVSDYDALQIWDLEPGESAIHANGIEDKTGPTTA